MHSVMEIEEKIRQRYRQPKGVEQFGIEPVPPKLKTVRWHDIFAIIFELALNPGSWAVWVWSVACHFGGQLAPLPPEFCWQPLPTQSPRRLLSTIACPARFSMRMVYGLRGAKWTRRCGALELWGFESRGQSAARWAW